jgi:hypothetical protein
MVSPAAPRQKKGSKPSQTSKDKKHTSLIKNPRWHANRHLKFEQIDRASYQVALATLS